MSKAVIWCMGKLGVSWGACLRRGVVRWKLERQELYCSVTLYRNRGLPKPWAVRLYLAHGSKVISRYLEMRFRMITLAPRGSVIYVDDGKLPGKGAYTRVRSAIFGDMGPPTKNDLGRIATSEDLLIRGVAGWLSRNAPAAIERLKLGGFELPDGTITVSGSDIVRAIAANISVTPLVTYVIQEAP